MAMPTADSAEARARKRVKNYTDFMWHFATYLIINAFLWGLDILQGGGVEWAFWVTIAWGLGVAFHAAAYWLDERGLQNRKYHRFLAEEQAKEDHKHVEL